MRMPSQAIAVIKMTMSNPFHPAIRSKLQRLNFASQPEKQPVQQCLTFRIVPQLGLPSEFAFVPLILVVTAILRTKQARMKLRAKC